MMRSILRLFVTFGLIVAFAIPSGAVSADENNGPAGSVPRSSLPITSRGPILGKAPTIQTLAANPTKYDPSGNLDYHGGRVMRTSTVYTIFWRPTGFGYGGASYRSLINTYFQDVAADSGKTTNVYSTDTQYYHTIYGDNRNILYYDTFAATFLDTTPFPASGCSSYASGSDSFPVCLTDAQLQTEILSVATSQGWMVGPRTMFLLYLPRHVGQCVDASNAQCFETVYCAYHSSFTAGGTTYYYGNEPYPTVGNGCTTKNQGFPNGNPSADAAISLSSHEHNETITDRDGDAWWDNYTGNENGDNCNFIFGPALGGTGDTQYNQVINGHRYYIQQEWSNAARACVQHT